MQIAVRPYLSAGISVSAASVIALAPSAIPAQSEPVVPSPKVTVSDIRLTVTPEEVVAFFNELQTQLAIINTAVGLVISIPGQSLVTGLEAAIELNDDLYDALRESTSNPTLLALFDVLQRSADVGLASLADAVAIIGGNSLVALRDVADLVTGTLTGSLANVLSAVVAVSNDPMNFANYAGLLGAGVATGELIADNGLGIVQELGDVGFVIADAGVRTVQDQINNAIQTVRGLIDIGAGIPGSELVSAVVNSVQEIVIGPAQTVLNIPFGVTTDVLGGAQTGFNIVVDNAQDLIASVSTDLRTGIGAIGANPLDPTSYLIASTLVAASGFDAFNTTVGTVGRVAQIPFSVASGIIADTVAGAVVDETRDLADAFAGVLDALGLPENTVNVPLGVADTVEALINRGASVVVDVLDATSAAIADGSAGVIAVSNAIEDASLGSLPRTIRPPAQADPRSERSAMETSGEPSGGEATVAAEDEVTDEEVTEDAKTDDQATDGDDATGDRRAASEVADSDDAAPGEKVDSDTADRGDRDAEKGERRSEKAQQASDSRADG